MLFYEFTTLIFLGLHLVFAFVHVEVKGAFKLAAVVNIGQYVIAFLL